MPLLNYKEIWNYGYIGGPDDYVYAHTHSTDAAERHVGRNPPLPNACSCVLESIGAVATALMSMASVE